MILLGLLLALARAEEPPTRAFKIGAGALAPVGGEVSSAYEFLVTRKFVLGIDLALRGFGSGRSGVALGYGLELKHYLAAEGWGEWAWRPYFAYGLLSNLVWPSGRNGSGLAHDTKLGVGTDFGFGTTILFAELAAHYSVLRHFEDTPLPLSFAELAAGARFVW